MRWSGASTGLAFQDGVGYKISELEDSEIASTHFTDGFNQ